jgi:hypothetical protein
MKWEHVIHSVDPKTAVREVHIVLEDKEIVIKETADGRKEISELATNGAQFRSPLQYTVMWLPLDETRPCGADYTKPAPFDCTAEYWGDGKGMKS